MAKGGDAAPEDIAIIGTESEVRARLRGYADAGATDLCAAPLGLDADRDASYAAPWTFSRHLSPSPETGVGSRASRAYRCHSVLSLEALMDALDLLTADHNRVRGLFGRFKDAEDENKTAEQAELAGKIVEELEIHTTIEEEIFYPAVHDLSSPIGDVVDEGLEEHHVAKTLIGELQPLEAGSDQWVAKMKVLIESVEHHAEEEEKEMFPKVRSATLSRVNPSR